MRSIITKAIALLITFSVATFAQEKGSFTDSRDKKTYKTVKIGEQVWMAENLNFNADGSKCYDNKPANCTKYGKLYNWAMAMALPDNCNDRCDSTKYRSICPSGWHLPDTSEWNVLVNMAGGVDTAGKVLKTKSGWNKNGNGGDKFGFSALPGGYVNFDASSGKVGSSSNVGNTGSWWTSDGMLDKQTETLKYSLAIRQNVMGAGGSVTSIAKSIYYDRADFDQGKAPRRGYLSIRCLQNDEKYDAAVKAEEETKKKAEAEVAAKERAEVEALEAYVKANGGTFTDTRDKKTYKTIKINGQIWLAENLDYTAENSKCYDDKPENCAKYGKLYNWESATKSCPAGWHLPKNEEWDKLYRSADGTNGTESPYKSKTAGKFLKAANGWNNNGTDKFGFSALPGGYNSKGSFSDVGGSGFGGSGNWWTASEYGKGEAYRRYINNRGEEAGHNPYNNKSDLLSVRCIKD